MRGFGMPRRRGRLCCGVQVWLWCGVSARCALRELRGRAAPFQLIVNRLIDSETKAAFSSGEVFCFC